MSQDPLWKSEINSFTLKSRSCIIHKCPNDEKLHYPKKMPNTSMMVFQQCCSLLYLKLYLIHLQMKTGHFAHSPRGCTPRLKFLPSGFREKQTSEGQRMFSTLTGATGDVYVRWCVQCSSQGRLCVSHDRSESLIGKLTFVQLDHLL